MELRSLLVAENTRDDHVDTASCGPRTGRSAHREGPMPGTAAILLAGRAIGFWLYARGGKKNMKRPCTRSQEDCS
jgi:hypothetical protein